MRENRVRFDSGNSFRKPYLHGMQAEMRDLAKSFRIIYLQGYAGGCKKIRAALRGDVRLTPLEIHSYTGANAEPSGSIQLTPLENHRYTVTCAEARGRVRLSLLELISCMLARANAKPELTLQSAV